MTSLVYIAYCSRTNSEHYWLYHHDNQSSYTIEDRIVQQTSLDTCHLRQHGGLRFLLVGVAFVSNPASTLSRAGKPQLPACRIRVVIEQTRLQSTQTTTSMKPALITVPFPLSVRDLANHRLYVISAIS